MVLILLALVLPWQYVIVRIVIGAILIFGIAPLVVRLVSKSETPEFAMPLPCARAGESYTAQSGGAGGATTMAAFAAAEDLSEHPPRSSRKRSSLRQ